jgi:hypothetical protein
MILSDFLFLMDIKTESESENITNLSWVCFAMYDNAKSIAFASAVKIDALSGNLILDVRERRRERDGYFSIPLNRNYSKHEISP